MDMTHNLAHNFLLVNENQSTNNTGGLHFYRGRYRIILTGSLTVSANAGSADSPLGRAEQSYNRNS